jgi:hypothetical protein
LLTSAMQPLLGEASITSKALTPPARKPAARRPQSGACLFRSAPSAAEAKRPPVGLEFVANRLSECEQAPAGGLAGVSHSPASLGVPAPRAARPLG